MNKACKNESLREKRKRKKKYQSCSSFIQRDGSEILLLLDRSLNRTVIFRYMPCFHLCYPPKYIIVAVVASPVCIYHKNIHNPSSLILLFQTAQIQMCSHKAEDQVVKKTKRANNISALHLKLLLSGAHTSLT